jgi:DNA polymerase-3 subunit delta
MQLPLQKLPSHLSTHALKPVYLISGDTPLLIQEARDAIRKASITAGFQQRELFHIETGFNWDQFTVSTQNLNLFSDKTLLECRNSKGKFDTTGTKILLRYFENPPPDKLLVIITDKLTATQKKTKWVKAVEKVGASITVYPISKHELPNWISQRIKQAGLKADTDSIRLLAELTEGNLLATQQAIEKLRLLYADKSNITINDVASVASNNARFNVFDFGNTILAGHQRDALRCLSGLKYSGTEATLVLWSISREIRELLKMKFDIERGIPLQEVTRTQWDSRKQLIKTALQRLPYPLLCNCLQKAESIDHMIKGLKPGSPWNALESLSISMTTGAH